MYLRSRTWFLLSLLFFVGAVFFWLFGNDYQARKKTTSPPSVLPGKTNDAFKGVMSLRPPFPLLTRLDNPTAPPVPLIVSSGSKTLIKPIDGNRFPLRLSNSLKSAEELARSENSILLRNAFVDTTRQVDLAIPDHLRAAGDPGSYVVQARGPTHNEFRARLRDVGASIVSYIPNNAYLVKLSRDGAKQLEGSPHVQAVIPFEPYYKLETRLLALAVEKKILPPETWLRVTLFPDELEAGRQAVVNLGAEILNEEPSPFGPQLLLRPRPDSLPALAQLSSVQGIESFVRRAFMNDLTRVIVGVATNTTTAGNYLGLSGSNVVVNLNDSGVDNTHPALAGRVFAADPAVFMDVQGHGTHVAATIAGNGAQSSSVKGIPPGSVTNANFRGMAPQARIFILPIETAPAAAPPVNDTFLQETAAKTNSFALRRGNAPFISNNSWGFPGANEYDSSAARFDAAVRDALPGTPDSQPATYVFTAGNSGEGSDTGLDGHPNSVASPGTAKNVITVGASELPRFITNEIVRTLPDSSVVTNVPFLEVTDTADQIAAFSSRGNVGIGLEGQFGRFKPDVVAPGSFVISARSKYWVLSLTNTTDTNVTVIAEVNKQLAPFYRYESGTSMSAPVVSGMLALMQEFFEQRLPAGLRRTNSPALMKALLIHGARSLGGRYDLQIKNTINYQGWGLINLTNTIPAQMLTEPESAWPIQFFDQNPTNALATGDSRSWDVKLTPDAQQAPLRFTLVWTDPPGNPNAGIKLVNDLDLVVSNTVTSEVFIGNNIPASSDFTPASSPGSPPARDIVNNVESVFIREPIGSNFVVSVIGRRVNVAAVSDLNRATQATNDIAQDFALVISTGDLFLTNAFKITPSTNAPPTNAPALTVMTNGVPILRQRAGAQPPLINVRDGITNQWNFFVFTNTYVTNDFSSLTNGTNVAFITFLTPNVSRARNLEADIDLYVSTNPRLLELDTNVLASAFKSAGRGGTESVVFTNAALGDVFYIGVKAEDQQAGEYGLIGLSSNDPFDRDNNGNRILQGFPTRAVIPDGTADNPGSVQIFAVGLMPNTIQRVIVTNIISHGNLGDLIGILSHGTRSTVLNNHTLNNGFFSGTNLFIYDDSYFAPVLGSRRTDGPGSLNDFMGQQASGVWMLNMIDNSLTQTGRVERLIIRVEPMAGDLSKAGPGGLSGNVGPHDRRCFTADVPPEATNMIVRLSQMTGPLQITVRRDRPGDTNEFDKAVTIAPPGGDLNLGLNDQPNPLSAGRYFVCAVNDSDALVQFHIATLFQLGVDIDSGRILVATNIVALPDAATVTSSLDLPVDKEVVSVEVGVRLNHSRASDLSVHLISPQGTRILLAENRGGTANTGFGGGIDTNVSYTIFTEDTNRFANLAPLKFSLPPFTNIISGPALIPVMSDGFEESPPGVYLSNTVASGWLVTRSGLQIRGKGSSGIIPASGTNYAELQTPQNPGSILRTFPTQPGVQYLLSFAYNRNPAARAGVAHALQLYYGPTNDFRPPVKFISVPDTFGWTSTDVVFTATSSITALEIAALTSAGPLIDSVQVNNMLSASNTFVLPEESLSLLKGERAIGEWKLEVTDTRSGTPAGLAPSLVSWELQLKYGEPREKAITLTNGVSFSGILTNQQTNYFIVDVCETAKQAFLTLTGPSEKLRLLVDRSGLPTGNLETDDFTPVTNKLSAATGTSMAQFVLDDKAAHPAPLQPGKKFFVAVHGIEKDGTNHFTLQVDLDRDECHGPRPIIRLGNDIPYTNSIPPLTNLFGYYVFTPSCIAAQVKFELIPVNGDLGLVVRKGPQPPLPDLIRFDYRSDNPGITNEVIIVTTNSTPVVLAPNDDWFLGVYSRATNSVIYSIRATELSDTGKVVGRTNFTTLTNAVPLDVTINYCPQITNYFVFSITNPVPAVKFELTNLVEDVDLFIGFKTPPSLTNYFLSNSVVVGTVRTQTIIQTNAATPDLRGDWFLSVTPKKPSNLRFTIVAEILTELPPPVSTNDVVINPNLQIATNQICLSWPSTSGLQYRIEAKTNVDDRAWTVVRTITATGGRSSSCIDRPTPFRYFQIVQTGTTLPPPPPPGTNVFITPSVTVTTNNICLTWNSQVGLQYRVEAKTNIEGVAWIALTNFTASATTSSFCLPRPTGFRFFEIVQIGTVQPPPPPPSTNVFINPTASITASNLCLSWNSQVGQQYRVEAKTNLQDIAWTALTNFAAVSTNSSFCVARPTGFRFFEIVQVGTVQPPPPPPSTNVFINPTASISGTNLCLAWNSQVGQQYRVEAKTNVPDTTWTVLTNITAISTNSSFCLARPTGFRFFQIVQVGTVQPPPPPPSTNVVINPTASVTASNICLSWNSQIGQQYRVEAKSNVQDVAWTVLTNLTAISTNSTFCLARPTGFRFFQIMQIGSTTTPPVTPPSTNVFINPAPSVTASNVCLSWNSRVGQQYRVEGKTNIQDAAWSVLTNITAVATNSSFCVARSSGLRFFQVVELAGTQPTPPPQASSGDSVVNFNVELRTNTICLLWLSQTNVQYRVEAKTNQTDQVWAVRGTLKATETNSVFCIDRNTGYRFFQVIQEGQGTATASDVRLNPTVVNNQLQFKWTAIVGKQYALQAATNLVTPPPINWLTITNITATQTNMTIADPSPLTNRLRFYRLIAP